MACDELETLQEQLERSLDNLSDARDRCLSSQIRDQETVTLECIQYWGLQAGINDLSARIQACLAQVTLGVITIEGKVTFLRAHATGGYGPAHDHLAGEVIFKVDSSDTLAFGLWPDDDVDGYRDQHDRMYELLVTAVSTGFPVTVDYVDVPNRTNLEVVRIALLPQHDDFGPLDLFDDGQVVAVR